MIERCEHCGNDHEGFCFSFILMAGTGTTPVYLDICKDPKGWLVRRTAYGQVDGYVDPSPTMVSEDISRNEMMDRLISAGKSPRVVSLRSFREAIRGVAC